MILPLLIGRGRDRSQDLPCVGFAHMFSKRRQLFPDLDFCILKGSEKESIVGQDKSPGTPFGLLRKETRRRRWSRASLAAVTASSDFVDVRHLANTHEYAERDQYDHGKPATA